MVPRALESRRQPLARGERGQSRRASWSWWRRGFPGAETEPRSFRTLLCSVLILSWDPLFIGPPRTGTEVGAQEDKWNFQGRDDVMVPVRKQKLADSEALIEASLPWGDVIIAVERRRRGEGRNGLYPRGKWYTKGSDRD